MRASAHRRILQAIFILGLLGVLLASFLTVTHYTGTPGTVCPKHKSGVPTCDIVNQSIYAEIMGIPIALIAVFVYGAYSVMAYLLLTGRQIAGIRPPHLRWGLMLLSGTSLLFAMYLGYVLYFIIKTICVYCVAAHTITLAIFALSVTLLLSQKRK
jgi:uncharacterized membrane protein